jgi:hypothetical protein
MDVFAGVDRLFIRANQVKNVFKTKIHYMFAATKE